MNYKSVPLKEQVKILKKHFKCTVGMPDTVPLLPTGAEEYFLIPSWRKIAPTYPEAVQKALNALKSTRPFYNLQEGQIDAKHLRQRTELKQEIIAAQFGEMFKGSSIYDVRISVEAKRNSQVLFGTYEVAIMLLTHPDRLTKYEDLWIDCPNDEWSWNGDGDFSLAPVFGFGGGDLRFVAGCVDGARDGYGSGSGFGSGAGSQTLDPRPLESLDSLSLESAIKMVKEAGYKVVKEY